MEKLNNNNGERPKTNEREKLLNKKTEIVDKMKKPITRRKEMPVSSRPRKSSILVGRQELPHKKIPHRYMKSEKYRRFEEDRVADNKRILDRVSDFINQGEKAKIINEADNQSNITEAKEEDEKTEVKAETKENDSDFDIENKRIMDSINANSDKIIKEYHKGKSEEEDIKKQDEVPAPTTDTIDKVEEPEPEVVKVIETTNENPIKTIEENISDEEYKEFVDNNKVTDDILSNIADKIKKRVQLSLRERAIHMANTSKIEEKIKESDKNIQTDKIVNQTTENNTMVTKEEVIEEIEKDNAIEKESKIFSFDSKFIKNKLEEILKTKKEIKSVGSIEIIAKDNEFILYAQLTAGKWGLKTDIDLENAHIVNDGNGIKLDPGFEVYSTLFEDKVKKLVSENMGSLNDEVKKIIEKENNIKIEKIWIENGELKAMSKTEESGTKIKNENKETTESYKIGEQTFNSKEELFAYLDINAVDKDGNPNLSFFDYEKNNWPEPKTVSAINEWDENFKAEKRETNQQDEIKIEKTNDNDKHPVEEKISNENINTIITVEEIKKRAHDIYEQRQKEGKEGDEKSDWEEAEKQLNKEQKNENQEGQISQEKIENLEGLLGDLEKTTKEKLESGPLSSRLKGDVLKGLDKWENFGKGEEGVKGFAKRFTKMAVNLALIGAISSVSVEKFAEIGVGTASALSGGATSYLGRKMAIGLGIGGAVELGGKKIPDKVKKWLPYIMAGASVGVTALTGGLAPAAAVGLSSAAGYFSSRLIKGKYSSEQIIKNEEDAKKNFQERIKNGETLTIDEIEKEYTKILKKYENQRVWGRLLDGAKKLGVGALVSSISLEASGFARDAMHHEATVEKEHTQLKVENKIETSPIIEHKSVDVEFSSHGGIQTILDMKEKIHNEYPDISKAPASVQEFINANPTQEAIKLGFYNPNDPSGAESMVVLKGSTLEFDQHGNLCYHDIKTGQEHLLVQMKGDTETIEKYHGKMFDSDHSGIKTEHIDYKVPEQVDPVTGQHILQTEAPETIGNDNKISPQVDLVTGLPLVHESTDINHGETNTEQHINLSQEGIRQVNTTLNDNIHHLFPDNEHNYAWDNVKGKTPDDLFKLEKEGSLIETYKPLASYLHKLEEETGLRPRSASILNPIPETNFGFIERALQKTQEMGQLDKVKL